MTISSVIDDSLFNHLVIISPPKKPRNGPRMSESYASFGSTLGSIWIWPCSKSTYLSGWSTCFSIFRKKLGGSNAWKEFGCLWWCTHSQNWAVNWSRGSWESLGFQVWILIDPTSKAPIRIIWVLMDQLRPLRRKKRKIWPEICCDKNRKLQ